MAFNVTGNFAAPPTGAFTNGNKKLTWAGQSLNQDFDTGGKWYSIVSDSRFEGGRACRMKYGAGRIGMADQSYQWMISSPRCAVAVEFDWLFEDGFSWCTSGGPKSCTLKVGPCIQWGPVGGDNNLRGTRCMWWANGNGSNYPPAGPKWFPSVQDQRSGNQLLQPVVYGPKIETNRIYRLKIEMWGGSSSHAYAKFWCDGQLIGSVSGKSMENSDDDHVYFDFAFFAGGGDQWYAPEHDSYARHGNIRCYSVGSEIPVEPPVEQPPPVDQPPPSAEPAYRLAVDEVGIFRARFWDESIIPPIEVPAKGDVKWSLTPNNVSWGPQVGDAHWQAIEVRGKTPGKCSLTATDPATGIATKPIPVEVTTGPHTPAATAGLCRVEPLPPGTREHAAEEFSDEPPS